MGSGYRRTRLKLDQPAPTPCGRSAPPPSLAQDARRRHARSIALPSRQRQARLEPVSDRLLPRFRLEVLLEFAGQLDESRRKADVLVERIAPIVPGNDFRTALIGHGGGDFVEAGA